MRARTRRRRPFRVLFDLFERLTTAQRPARIAARCKKECSARAAESKLDQEAKHAARQSKRRTRVCICQQLLSYLLHE